MHPHEEDGPLLVVNEWVEWIIFSIILILEIVFLIRFRFKTDRGAYIVLLTYLTVAGMSAFAPTTPYKYELEYIALPIGGMIIWMILYYFVFEMSFIRAKVESDSLDKYLLKIQMIKRQRILIYAVFLCIYVPINITFFLHGDNFFHENNTIFVILLLTRALTKSSFDVFMFSTFLTNFRFFVSKKRLALEQRFIDLTSKQKAVITWCYIMFAFKLLHSVSSNVLYSAYRLIPENDITPGMRYTNTLFKFTLVSITDFLNFLTLLYLFYNQGLAAEAARNNNKS